MWGRNQVTGMMIFAGLAIIMMNMVMKKCDDDLD